MKFAAALAFAGLSAAAATEPVSSAGTNKHFHDRSFNIELKGHTLEIVSLQLEQNLRQKLLAL